MQLFVEMLELDCLSVNYDVLFTTFTSIEANIKRSPNGCLRPAQCKIIVGLSSILARSGPGSGSSQRKPFDVMQILYRLLKVNPTTQ